MNYRHIYMQIISAAKNQQKLGLRPKNQNQRKNFPNQYFEFHHILPRSLFPNWSKRKSNIVPLTAREHFFCHQLLTKIYPSFEMQNAMWFLCICGKYKVSSRLYEKLKIERSKKLRENPVGFCLKAPFWNNGIVNVRSFEKPDSSFEPGRKRKLKVKSSKSACKGLRKGMRHFYRNDTHIRAFECPVGFKLGSNSKTHKSNEYRKKMSEIAKEKGWRPPHRPQFGNTNTKGKTWYTNGVENKMCFEKPEGFWPGKTIKNKCAMKNEICFCGFCKKECKNKLSLMNHERVCRLNPSRQRIEDYAWGHKKTD